MSSKKGKGQKPKKVWRVKVPVADAVVVENRRNRKKEVALAAMDFRGPNNADSTTDQVMSNANSAINITAIIAADSLSGVALSVVSYAMQRGFASEGTDENFPFWSYIYLIGILASYSKNLVPQIQMVPRWLSIIGQALMNKRVKLRSGFVSYNFQPDVDNTAYGYIQPIGPGNAACSWNCGVAGTGLINGFLRQVNAPVGYTAAGGSDAWTSLAQFLASLTSDGVSSGWCSSKKMHELLPSNSTNRFTTDVSAYTNNAICLGNSYGGNAGFQQRVGLEVPIFTPLMSTFSAKSVQVGPEPTRSTNFVRSFSGSGIFTGGMIATHLRSEKQVKFKTPPVFKCVDFLEVLDVVAHFVSYAAQEASLSAINGTILSISPAQFQCPLSLQEVGLLLRNVCMNAFKASQYMAQGTFPTDLAGPGDKNFIPFVSGFGTYPSAETSMLLPLPLVENLRCLGMTWNMGSRDKLGNPNVYVPILGVYVGAALNQIDYSFESISAGLPVGVPSFRTPAFKSRTRANSLGKSDIIVGAEVTVSYVDGKSGSNYYMINDESYLDPLAELWNSWINDITNVTGTLSTLGTDAGINILKTITTTNLIIDTDSDYSRSKISSLIKDLDIMDDRLLQTRELKKIRDSNGKVGNPFAQSQAIVTMFVDPPLQSVWESALQYFIRPSIRLNLGSGIEANVITQPKIQSISREPHSIVFGDALIGLNLEVMHSNFARLFIKQPTSDMNAIYKFLDDAAVKGRGGILSSLIAGFAGAVGGPEVGNIASTVASFLPI